MTMEKILRRWNAYRRTVNQLEALDNRVLADIGIKRGDIDTVAREYAAQF